MKTEKFVIAFLIAFSLAIIFSLFSPQQFLGILLVILIGILFVINPQKGVFILIFILTLRGLLGGQRFFYGLPFSIDSGGLINIFINLWGILYIVVWRRKVFFNKLVNVYFLFLIICLFSCFISKDIFLSLRYLSRISTPLFIYIICWYEIIDNADRNKLMKTIIFASFIPIGIGVFEFICNFSKDYRLAGIFGHPNPYSFYLIILFSATFPELLSSKVIKDKVLISSYSFLTAMLILLTYCRVTWIALVAVLFFVAFYFRKKRYILFAGGLIFIVIFFNLFSVQDRIQNVILFFLKGDLFNSGNSIGWRFKAWDLIFREFLKNPLMGYGLRSHFSLITSLFGWSTSVHNSYLEILYDTGALGFSLFLLFLVFLIVDFFKMNRENVQIRIISRNDYFENKKYFAIYGAAVISYLLILITDNILEYYDIGSFYWIIFAVAHRIYFNLKIKHARKKA